MSERARRLYEQHLATSRIAAEMFEAGIFVDERERRRLSNRLRREHREKKAELLRLVDVKAFKCNPNDLRSLIYKRHETATVRRFSLRDPYDPKMWKTPERISVAEGALRKVLIHPDTPFELQQIIEAYWACQAPRKARSTFVSSDKVLHAIGRDGRLRPGWNSCGTDTGRWSCSAPNVMNLPQELRSMYCAPRGRLLVHGDFSQLELRVMAAVSQDAALAAALASGDVYSYGARLMFGIPEDQPVKKEARQATKIITLASQYAAGTAQVFNQYLAQDKTGTYAKVRIFHEGWKKMRAGTVAYWGDEMKRVQHYGFSESRIMRRRRVYPAEPPITEVANYPIQSTAADVMNVVTIELAARLKKEFSTARLIIQLHDALDIECDEDDVFGVMDLLTEVMETPRVIDGRTYVFPTEVKCGVSWASV